LTWMSSVLARMAAGTSSARVNRAVFTALPRADPEGMEPLGERVFGQRASCPASREQPGGRDAEQAAARCLAAGRERAGEGVQRGGQHDGPAPAETWVSMFPALS
jgi:hypothetical protein